MILNGKTYSFAGFNNNGQSVFRNTDADYPSGISFLTSKVNTPTGAKDTAAKWNLSIPHIATASSACSCEGSVLGTDYFSIEGKFSAATSAAGRLDAYERLKSLVATDEFKATFIGLTQPSA